MHEKQLEKVIPNMTKGLVLVTTLKHPVVSTLILPGQSELSDVQQVIRVGPYVGTFNIAGEKINFGEGDWVKVNYKRFWKPKERKSIKDGNEYNATDMECYIPIVEFNKEQYLLIDQGDIEYYWNKDSIK